jgi:DNA invertase Pin-like site-specific DNA recombinase
MAETNSTSLRVAIYARVSTTNHGQDVGMQTRELREYCERRGWTVSGEFIDVGISGTKDRRPELDRLMECAHRRRFDVIAVWKFDRFARSVSHLLRALDTFRVLGVEFVSLSESLDTATPAGRMVFTVLGAVAELERSLTVERVKAGLRNARSKGKRLGRPAKVVDVRRIAALRSQGLGWKKIAKQMGIGVSTVLRASQIASEGGSEIPTVMRVATSIVSATV